MDSTLENALIGLAPTALNSAITLIAGLVHQKAPVLEDVRGPGTGPVKFTDLFGSVITDLQKAAAAGQIDKVLPSDDLIKLIMQSVVTSMKLQGQLDGVLTSIPLQNTNAATQKLPPSTVVSANYKLTPGMTLIVSA